MHLNAQSVYLKYLTFSNFLNLFPHKHWECYISVNTLPLQTAVPGLAVPGAAGARHQHGDACHHARTAPRKLFNQVEYLIVSTCPGLSCQVHLVCTFCKFINQTFGTDSRSADINTILLCRPHSASSSRKKVTVSDYGDFYSDKRDRKSEPKQDNSALHESIKQVQCLHDMLNAMLIYKTQKMFVIPEKLNFDSLGHWCFLAAMSVS